MLIDLGIETGTGLTFLSIAITFWAWYNGRQTRKLIKEWRKEDMNWRREQAKRDEEWKRWLQA